jgi:hypothetical protein
MSAVRCSAQITQKGKSNSDGWAPCASSLLLWFPLKSLSIFGYRLIVA